MVFGSKDSRRSKRKGKGIQSRSETAFWSELVLLLLPSIAVSCEPNEQRSDALCGSDGKFRHLFPSGVNVPRAAV